MTAFVTRFDFRAPGASPRERAAMYATALDMAAYVEESGDLAVMVSEHHASDDGYLPSPLVAAAAIAARTSTIAISVSALLVNLHDPIRLAEDIAVLDHVSGGRVSYTLGLGYRPEEYALLGRSWSTRGRDMDTAIETLLSAWSDGRVTPPPLSEPHPVLFVGGGSPAAARRAARFGLGFAPQVRDPELRALYEQGCRDAGREPGLVLMPPRGPATVFCAEDPDAFWATYGSFLLVDARAYAAWQAGARHHVADHSETVEALRAAGTYVVATPDEMVQRCQSREWPLITSHPLCGGMPAEAAWESLRLMRESVRPRLQG